MSKHVPQFEEWQKLWTVIGMADDIVDDSPTEVFDRGNRSAGLGLLDPVWGPIDPAGAATKSASKLAKWGAHFYDAVSEVERVFPGISNIGFNREERVYELFARLPQLTAYAWIRQRPDYVKACATIQRVQRPNHSKSERLWLELRLLRAVHPALSEYLMLKGAKYTPQYPTTEQLTSAAGYARKLKSFLKEHGGLFLGEHGLSWEIHSGAEAVAKALTDMSKQYAKPRADWPLLEHHYRQQVAKGLHKEFGTCSATILERLCNVVEHYPGSRLIQRLAAEVNLTGAKDDKGAR